MKESLTISKAPPLFKSMDFAYLRREALKVLQERAFNTWTDHNAHDPGITLLEVLCYAVTDLANRAALPVAILLPSQTGFEAGSSSVVLPPPEQILYNNACTDSDLRRLLIDIPGIRNARLFKRKIGELPLFLDSTSDEITYHPSDRQLEVKGLYDLYIECSNDLLNSNIVRLSQVAVSTATFDLSFALPYWDDLKESWGKAAAAIDQINFFDPATGIIELNVSDPDLDYYFAYLNVGFSDGTAETKMPVRMIVHPAVPGSLQTALLAELESRLLDTAGILRNYKERVQAVRLLEAAVRNEFLACRNIAEDLVKVRSVRFQEIAIKADIEISPNEDPNTSLARIFDRIDRFFSPGIEAQSLKTAFEQQKIPVEDIYEGPVLENGLITADQLLQKNDMPVVYTSDLIREIFEQEAVISIDDFSISSFIDNTQLTLNEVNCMALRDISIYRPRLSIDKSNITLTRNQVPIPYDQAEVERIFNGLRVDPVEKRTSYRIPVPAEESLDLDAFSSIQYDLPANYGVGDHIRSAPEHHPQSFGTKQFQGFLFFFDQVLINYNRQIAGLAELFSPGFKHRTYFAQPAFDIPGAASLIRSFQTYSGSWDAFIADPANPYRRKLMQITEDTSSAMLRNNRILDHLLARFGETYPAYNQLLYPGLNAYYFSEKSNFYRSYPRYSADRARAFDYRQPEVWNTDKVSGLQKRICALLGINNQRRTTLSGEVDISVYFEFFSATAGALTTFGFRYEEPDLFRLESTPAASLAEARNRALQLMDVGVARSAYGAASYSNGLLSVPIRAENGEVLAVGSGPSSGGGQADVDHLIVHLIGWLLQIHKYGEGMFLVEHILLRPRSAEVALLNRIQMKEILLDPYSMVVTFVLPSGYARDFNIPDDQGLSARVGYSRMRDPEFRKFVEETIRRETPAHLLPRIFWLPTTAVSSDGTDVSLENFEQRYRNWLLALRQPLPDAAAQNAMIELLNLMYLTDE